MLKPYQSEDILELGIDECGRGPLLGRVYIAGVILPNNIEYLRLIVVTVSSKSISNVKVQNNLFIKSVLGDHTLPINMLGLFTNDILLSIIFCLIRDKIYPF
jgi:ribonuclease HIII